MRCPDCTRFVGLETEPELGSLEVEGSDTGAVVTASVHVARNCADCSTELKAYDFETEKEVMFEEGVLKCKSREKEEGSHDLDITEEGTNPTESGGGRYKKNMVGYETEFIIQCINKGCDLKVSGSIEEEAAASEYEEQV